MKIELKHEENKIAMMDLKEFLSKLIFVAEIRPEGVPGLSSNNVLEKSRMMSMVRSVRSSGGGNGELVIGKVGWSELDEEKLTVQVLFNSEQHSWDYSWKSNRWEANKTHVIDVIVMEDTDDGSLHILKSSPSESFTIFSARHIKSNASVGLSARMGSHATTGVSELREVHGRVPADVTSKHPCLRKEAWQQYHKAHGLEYHATKSCFQGVDWTLPVPSSLGIGLHMVPAPNYPSHSYSDHNSRDSMLQSDFYREIYDQIEKQKRTFGYIYGNGSDSCSSTGDITRRYADGSIISSGSSAYSEEYDDSSGSSPKRRRTGSEDNKLLDLCNVIEAISKRSTNSVDGKMLSSPA